MRLKNEAGTWSAWQPFESEVQWQLTPGAGERTVTVELKSSSGHLASASDSITSTEGISQIFEDGFETGRTAAWSEVTGS